ncbi:hypothetical protein PF003_g10898 [Phytophthora fragariae]|nr:hypothetical protein PF003_g10898 [Phytophthora fragariae]
MVADSLAASPPDLLAWPALSRNTLIGAAAVWSMVQASEIDGRFG